MKRLLTVICALSLTVGLLSLSGCSGRGDAGSGDAGSGAEVTKGYVTRGEWLAMLAEAFGQESYRADEPYYSDIGVDHELFAAVQSMAEWNILSVYSSDVLEPQKNVTCGEVASTAVIAAGFALEEGGDGSMADAVNYALEWGIISSDEDLDKYMTSEECEKAIAAARHIYLNAPTEEEVNVILNEELIDLTDIPKGVISMDGGSLFVSDPFLGDVSRDDSGILTVDINTGSQMVRLRPGDTILVSAAAENPAGAAFKISAITETDGGIVFATEIPTLADLFDELVVHTTVSADPESIIWAEGVSVSPLSGNEISSAGERDGYRIALVSDRGDISGTEDMGQDAFSANMDWEFVFAQGDYEKTWTGKNSGIVGDGPGAQALAASNFVYDAVPGIEDFNGTQNVWTKNLETVNKFSAGYKITGNISVDLTATVNIEYHKVDFLFWKDIETPVPESADLKLTSDISAILTLEGNLEERLKIATVPIPLGATGLVVSVDLYLFVDASGSVQVLADLGSTARVEWAASANLRHTAESTANAQVQMAVDVDFGADLAASLDAFGIKLIDLGVKAGGNLTASASVDGKCEVSVEDGVTIEIYTETMSIESKLYVPVLSLYVGSDDSVIGGLGFQGEWEIIGKDNGAACYTLVDEEWEFWREELTIGPDGEILGQETVTAGKDVEEVVLSQTYTTQFGMVNAVTYPSFQFDYPDSWSVSESSVGADQEIVILTNEHGAQIKYYYFSKMINAGGHYNLVEVSAIADSAFVPGMIQATDYSDLGTFMVAELRRTAALDQAVDSDFRSIDGHSEYALLPKSLDGESVLVNPLLFDMEFSFRYGGYISFIASPHQDGFTDQEVREVIAILASFR